MFDGVKCVCIKDVSLWTSWTNKHAGRRFYNCKISKKNNGCSFYYFKDSEVKPKAKVLLRGLRDWQRELY